MKNKFQGECGSQAKSSHLLFFTINDRVHIVMVFALGRFQSAFKCALPLLFTALNCKTVPLEGTFIGRILTLDHF